MGTYEEKMDCWGRSYRGSTDHNERSRFLHLVLCTSSSMPDGGNCANSGQDYEMARTGVVV